MPSPKKIYLACPYTDHDPQVKEARFQAVNQMSARLIQEGYFVFSPISHTHPIALAGELPGHWEFWEAYDRSFLDWADEVFVLQLPGWETSKGVQGEIQYAGEAGKPVRYLSF